MPNQIKPRLPLRNYWRLFPAFGGSTLLSSALLRDSERSRIFTTLRNSRGGIFNNHREITFIPSLLNKAVVTPSPLTRFPFLFIHPDPQEGLPCFSMAFLILNLLAMVREVKAPFKKKVVRFSPFMEMTRLWWKRMSSPSPFSISTGGRGTGRPLSSSGQTGMAFPSLTNSIIWLFLASLPLNREQIPQRQAETKYLAL